MTDSEDALRLLKSINQLPDIVLSDMQHEDGLDVYRILHKKYPQVSYIIASGYAESGRVAQALDEGVHSFVRKPYTQTTLGTALKAALNKK